MPYLELAVGDVIARPQPRDDDAAALVDREDLIRRAVRQMRGVQGGTLITIGEQATTFKTDRWRGQAKRASSSENPQWPGARISQPREAYPRQFRNSTSSPVAGVASVRCRESGARTAMPARRPQDRSGAECRRRSASPHAGRRAAGPAVTTGWHLATPSRSPPPSPSGPLSSRSQRPSADARPAGRRRPLPHRTRCMPRDVRRETRIRRRRELPPGDL